YMVTNRLTVCSKLPTHMYHHFFAKAWDSTFLRFCMCNRKGDFATVPGRSRILSCAASASVRGLPSRNLTPVFLISQLFCKLRAEFSSNANHVIALSAPCHACFRLDSGVHRYSNHRYSK